LIDEATITRNIIEKAAKDWIDLSEVDVVVVGAGPSGLTAAYYLAKAGLKTVVFERKLSFGGGIGGGGMLFQQSCSSVTSRPNFKGNGMQTRKG